MKFIAAVWLVMLPLITYAHHYVNGDWPDPAFEIEGEVVRVHWGNPHPRLTIKIPNEAGEDELIPLETGGLGSIARMGIPRDTIKVGDWVRVAVRAPVRSGTRHLVENILLPNGTELVLAYAEPRWSDEYLVPTNFPTSLAVNEAIVAASKEQARGIFRVWSRDGANIVWADDLPLTAAARAAQVTFDAEVDNPIIRCVPPGMPRAHTANAWPIEFLEGDGEIVIRMEEYDIVRTVHMDAEQTNERPAASPLGYSVGRWAENTLIVQTTRINWPYFDDSGIPQSEAVKILERFTLSQNDSRLEYEIVVTDPEAFTEPVTGTSAWVWVPGQEVQPYACERDI